jgi:hypothetical protein
MAWHCLTSLPPNLYILGAHQVQGGALHQRDSGDCSWWQQGPAPQAQRVNHGGVRGQQDQGWAASPTQGEQGKVAAEHMLPTHNWHTVQQAEEPVEQCVNTSSMTDAYVDHCSSRVWH